MIEIPGVIKLGTPAKGSLLDIKLAVTSQHFKLHTYISILNGLLETELTLSISSTEMKGQFLFVLGQFTFNSTIQGPAPLNTERLQLFDATAYTDVKLPEIKDRTCVSSEVALLPPMSKLRLATCYESKRLPGFKDDINYADWGKNFSQTGCKANELIGGWKFDQCGGEFRAMLSTSCLRNLRYTAPTRRYSSFVVMDKLEGIRGLTRVGRVSCGNLAMQSFTFGPPPGEDIRHRSRGFKLLCVEPDWKFGYTLGDVMQGTTPCTNMPDGNLFSLSVLPVDCSEFGPFVLRAFEFQRCSGGGYRAMYECSRLVYVDVRDRGKTKLTLPISGIDFYDVAGLLIRLHTCLHDQLMSTDKEKKIETKLVNATSGDGSFHKMVCPDGWAMVSFSNRAIECRSMIESKVLAVDPDRPGAWRSWTESIQISNETVLCEDGGLIVGYKCGDRFCTDKYIMCQERLKIFNEVALRVHAYLPKMEEENFLQNFLLVPIKFIIEELGKALRLASAAADKAAELLEYAAESLRVAREKAEAAMAPLLDALKTEEKRHGVFKLALSRAEDAHGDCFFLECVATLLAVGASLVNLATHYIVLKIAILAVQFLAFTINAVLIVLEEAFAAAAELAQAAADTLSDITSSVMSVGGSAVSFLMGNKLLNSANFEINEISFLCKVETFSLLVKFVADFAVFGTRFDIRLEIDLNWQSIAESVVSKFMAVLGPIKTVLNDQVLPKVYELLRSSRQLYGRQDQHEVKHRDEASLFEDLSEQLSKKWSYERPNTRIQVETIDELTQVANLRRTKQTHVDEVQQAYDFNRGLSDLCAESARRRLRGESGIRHIRITNSVRRKRNLHLDAIPDCLFDSNPELRYLVLPSEVTGELPLLPSENELRVMVVSDSHLGGSWDSVVREANALTTLHVRNTRLRGRTDSWPLSLRSLSIGNTLTTVDPAALFLSMQNLKLLTQAFWDHNVYAKDQSVVEVRKTEGISKQAGRINPLFSVLYGVVEVTDLKSTICGPCDAKTAFNELNRHPSHCHKFEYCADQAALVEFEDKLARILRVQEVNVDALFDDGTVTISSRMGFADKRYQEDLLASIDESAAKTLNLNLRFGCTPGAVGSQCEYVCHNGWRRHAVNNDLDMRYFPQCVVPTQCAKSCRETLGVAMDECTSALYSKELVHSCENLMNDAKQNCPACTMSDEKGLDYDGTVSFTKSKSKCLAWSKVRSFVIPDNSDWSHNFCRNPNAQQETAWCFVGESGETEPCDIGTTQSSKCHNLGTSCFDMALAQFLEIFR